MAGTATPGRARRLLGRVGAPVISQGLTAGTSLLLQVVAARSLGLAEFGAFALFLSLLVSATALYTGYVGDSLAVLDRGDPRIRGALATSAVCGLALAGAVAAGTALVVRHGDPATAFVYAGMVVLWLIEETFRRLLIARLEFWRLVGNDLAYLLGTAVALGAWEFTAHEVSLPMIFGAMGVGAAAAIVTGFAQVPARERGGLRPGWAGMRELLSFAGWRALQTSLRPAALTLSRLLVANLVSLAAVGVLEAGRLVVAPLQVVINGAGSFLLAGFAAAERAGTGARGLAERAAMLLLLTTAGGGALIAVFARPLGGLMIGSPVDPLLVLGWAAYLGVWAAGLPYVTEVVARKRSRDVFVTRLVDSAAGLALAGTALVAGFPLTAVPWLMAVGGLYSALRLRSLAVRTRGAPAAPAWPGADDLAREVRRTRDLEATIRFRAV
jgi:O-antigen/teichoic acid export membrane protein